MIEIYRFHESVALNVGGSTVYVDREDALKLASALRTAALDVRTRLFTESTLATVQVHCASHAESRERYKVVRFYALRGKRTIRTGLTLAEAQAHCSNPETSSTTAKRSRVAGSWFDGYERQ